MAVHVHVPWSVGRRRDRRSRLPEPGRHRHFRARLQQLSGGAPRRDRRRRDEPRRGERRAERPRVSGVSVGADRIRLGGGLRLRDGSAQTGVSDGQRLHRAHLQRRVRRRRPGHRTERLRLRKRWLAADRRHEPVRADDRGLRGGDRDHLVRRNSPVGIHRQRAAQRSGWRIDRHLPAEPRVPVRRRRRLRRPDRDGLDLRFRRSRRARHRRSRRSARVT